MGAWIVFERDRRGELLWTCAPPQTDLDVAVRSAQDTRLLGRIKQQEERVKDIR